MKSTVPASYPSQPYPTVACCEQHSLPNGCARQTRLLKERRLIGSFTHGSMANALPQSIGAQFCYPGRQVIAMAGDGGLAMLMGDLLTMTQYDLPIPAAEWFGGGDLSVAADPHNLGASDSSSPHKRPKKHTALFAFVPQPERTGR